MLSVDEINKLKAENEELSKIIQTKSVALSLLRDENIQLKKWKFTYKENLKLCKWQEQHISKLANVIQSISDIVLGTYDALDSQALQEIRQILAEVNND